MALTKPEQLLDIPGNEDLYLPWEILWAEGKTDRHKTIIRNGQQVLFTEPICWEAIGLSGVEYSRYEDICKILKQKRLPPACLMTYIQKEMNLDRRTISWMLEPGCPTVPSSSGCTVV